MTNFNKGWFNCFCSFISEVVNANGTNGNLQIIINVAKGAGVTCQELKEVIKETDDQEIKYILKLLYNEFILS